MREVHFWPKMKFESIFFQVSWQFINPKGSLLGRAEGGFEQREEATHQSKSSTS